MNELELKKYIITKFDNIDDVYNYLSSLGNIKEDLINELIEYWQENKFLVTEKLDLEEKKKEEETCHINLDAGNPELNAQLFNATFSSDGASMGLAEDIEDTRLEKIDNFIEDLYDLRKSGIAKDGEYSLENLIFKEMRNLGYLDNLKTLKKKIKSQDLSLEKLDEGFMNGYEDPTKLKDKLKNIELYTDKNGHCQVQEYIDKIGDVFAITEIFKRIGDIDKEFGGMVKKNRNSDAINGIYTFNTEPNKYDDKKRAFNFFVYKNKIILTNAYDSKGSFRNDIEYDKADKCRKDYLKRVLHKTRKEIDKEVIQEMLMSDYFDMKMKDKEFADAILNKEEIKKIDEDVEELDITTPYMLRNDGKLFKCGSVHPYIKYYFNYPDQKQLEELFKLHIDSLDWLEEHTQNEETKELIKQLRETKSIEILDRLNKLVNQEFCRVRTSNPKYKVGGNNGRIYFRISSEDFDWSELIWDIVALFRNDIQYVNILNDFASLGNQDYITIKDTKIKDIPVDDFLTLF